MWTGMVCRVPSVDTCSKGYSIRSTERGKEPGVGIRSSQVSVSLRVVIIHPTIHLHFSS